MPIVHRVAFRAGWWGALAVIVLLAWFGRPLMSGASFEHGFFGLFWYTMLALATVLWALPSEQGWDGAGFYRRWRLLGLVTVLERRHALHDFSSILLEQEPAPFGRDHVWLILDGKTRLVFAHWRASVATVAAARQLADELATATGLPRQPAPSAIQGGADAG